MVFIGKGKAGAHDLGRQFLGFEGLVPGHEKKIEGASVAVAQKQIFAHFCAEYGIDLGAGLHRKGRSVVDPIVGDTQGIEQGIARLLLGNTGCVVGIAVEDGHNVAPW